MSAKKGHIVPHSCEYKAGDYGGRYSEYLDCFGEVEFVGCVYEHNVNKWLCACHSTQATEYYYRASNERAGN